MNKQTPLEVLEISEMIVAPGNGADFLDTNLLMWNAKYNTYGCIEDAKADNGKARRVKLRIEIYVEELE